MSPRIKQHNDQSSSTSAVINEQTMHFSITGTFEKYGEEKKSFESNRNSM
ncbi:hypothetical protein Gohar_013308 [Gossypium harknessii]|uniref:Uncharacterized protein n=1 Tax=Gossypium harknessii TaxID=34285 RepID=A0A7J9GZQ2_9ROSI|nr:hypothetical protein [Gossypium harknessii]